MSQVYETAYESLQNIILYTIIIEAVRDRVKNKNVNVYAMEKKSTRAKCGFFLRTIDREIVRYE